MWHKETYTPHVFSKPMLRNKTAEKTFSGHRVGNAKVYG